MNDIQQKIGNSIALLNRLVREHNPTHVFGLFSGGHDSLSASYIASKCERFEKIVHINTGIGVPATRQFVYDTCASSDWPLIELKASENTRADGTPDPMIYRDFILKYGFPGPGGHGFLYVKLKDRALQRLARQYGAYARKKKRIMLVSGCRSQESTRRMGTVEICQIDGRRIWVNPIHDWTGIDTGRLIEFTGLKRNPVVDLIHKSGECLCGAFAKPGEKEELKMWDETRPAYDEICAIEAAAKAAGKHAVWGTRPPRKAKCDTGMLPGALCWSCTKQEVA